MNNTGNNENPLVSVIVPVYNSERFLIQCVNSLLYQTLKNIEIILIDDGSTDSSSALCDKFGEQDKRVRVIHQKNGGYGKACNTGIKEVRAEYFGILESDDYAELEMFEGLYNLALSNNLDVVRCHFYNYNTLANTHIRIDLSHIKQNTVCVPRDDFCFFNQTPAVWSMLYNKNFINKIGIRFLETPGASYQDASFAFKVFACADRFMLTDKTYVHYRIDNENSSIASREKVFCVCDEYREIERFLKEKGMYKKLQPAILKIQFPTYMWNYRRIARKHRWPFLKRFAREMRGYISDRVINREVYSTKEIAKIYLIAFLYPLIHFLY